MKETDQNLGKVKLTDIGQTDTSEAGENARMKFKSLKKPLIFSLMAIVFVGCMYLIFVPDSKKESEEVGLNEAVPQATDVGMQEDKGKAYESDLMEQKELERGKSLSALSDFWNADSTASETANPGRGEVSAPKGADHHNRALSSYRNIQGTLGSFYEDRGETTQLQNEVRTLKSQLAQRENVVPANPVESQLALMEKSYQMAAKYFPSQGNAVKSEVKEDENKRDSFEKKTHPATIANIYPASGNIVSALYREPSDSVWLAELNSKRNRNFYGIGNELKPLQSANSIRACIHEEQIITGNAPVRIRLLETTKIGKLLIDKGTVLTGIAKFQGARLQVQISSVEFRGNIISVEIAVYDLDGQQGLAVPVSAERSAITETIANMGNTSGTSISLSSTAGQQLTADLSKSLVQGISGYFSKKVRMPKVTLKAGYQVFLLAKK
ncbi:conjugative transposon protein TraM [Chryseobacterium sp. SL1]|uniref:conjugative transposon protein TraM n=1 Tax=Chryseobacterium sp. SL1 TaxID=2995159 RepID=UPI002275937F|nr:conjugative transposon protein TraM [Chryseobacterium sp. SL1]MCY1662614.1 conjugative transposon protein TraM [Chryseobacterium sp. SL1]